MDGVSWGKVPIAGSENENSPEKAGLSGLN
jgi:hypothetical protein